MSRFSFYFLASCQVLGYVLVVAALWVCLMTGGEAFHGLLPFGAPVMPFDGVHFLQGLVLALAGMALSGWSTAAFSHADEELS